MAHPLAMDHGQALAAYGDGMSYCEWKLISDRPEDGQLCHVYDPTHEILKVWPAQYDAARDCFHAGSYGVVGWFEYDEVTHWMPLPPPPEE